MGGGVNADNFNKVVIVNVQSSSLNGTAISILCRGRNISKWSTIETIRLREWRGTL